MSKIPPIGKCEHGVPFDSECGECIENAQLVKAGKCRTLADEAERINELKKHPLKNPDSKHYQMIDGIESIDRLEQMYSLEEMAIWAKITAMKYRLRICNKDAIEKEAQKIKDYESYYKHLKELNHEM